MNSNFKPLIFRFLYMRFKGDISGLDELQERIDDAYFSVLSKLVGMQREMQESKDISK